MAALAFVQREERRLQTLARTANAAHEEGIRSAIIAGRALIEAKALVPHGRWLPWIKQHCTFSVGSAELYMKAAKHPGAAPHSLGEVLRALKTPHQFGFCSGDFEWYSPKPIVEAARHVLGRIDLDPASCEVANNVVKARSIYTVREDGLKQPWQGRVFVNPPYSGKLISRFIEKLVAHVRDGSVSEAIIVVNAMVEVRWFRTLADASAAICFPAGRVKFWKPGKKTQSAPIGTAIVYCGSRPKRFHRAFHRIGHVWFA